MSLMVGNLFWGNHLRCFGAKFRSMDAQVLFRSFRAKTTQSTTAITSIVIALSRIKALNMPSLRGSGEATTKQSKSRESNQNNESMTQKRINTDSLQVSDSQKAQSHPSGLPRLASQVSQ